MGKANPSKKAIFKKTNRNKATNNKLPQSIKEKKYHDSRPQNDRPKLSETKTYLIIMAFVGLVAAVGGYPGIKQILANWNDKAAFTFRPTTISLFPNNIDVNDSLFKTILLFSGILFNSGEKDLIPDNQKFELRMKFNDKREIRAYGCSLPKNLKINYSETFVNYNSINDLQNVSKLQPGDPINGDFAFSLKEGADTTIPRIVAEKPLFIISCTDIFGN